MDHKKFADWKQSVEELNQFASKIDSDRNQIYEWLANEIKEIFSWNGFEVRNVNFTKDGSVIQVWVEDASASIKFPMDFIESISMPFAVKRILNSDCNNELFVELYPLE